MAIANDDPKFRYFDTSDEPRRLLRPINGYQNLPLKSLDEAVQSLLSVVDDLQTNVVIAKKNCQDQTDNLTLDEAAAIYSYTMEGETKKQSLYYQLNQILRSTKRAQLMVLWLDYFKLLLTALYKLPSAKRIVWRGTKEDLSSQYKKGNTYAWWGFSSTTDSIDALQSNSFLEKSGVQTLFCIECENGKMIQVYSHYPEENEILLLPGFYFEVSGMTHFEGGLNIIHLKEVQPPYPLVEPPIPIKQIKSNDYVNIDTSTRGKENVIDDSNIIKQTEFDIASTKKIPRDAEMYLAKLTATINSATSSKASSPSPISVDTLTKTTLTATSKNPSNELTATTNAATSSRESSTSPISVDTPTKTTLTATSKNPSN
ncbi:unnamed protein product, partial [Didymodactylos carnosus]